MEAALKQKRLVLFDIDGTILHAKGIGAQALLGAMQQVYGRTFSRKGVVFSGATDPSIVASIFEQNNCTFDEEAQSKLPELWKSFIKRTERELKRATENPSRGQKPPKALPGVCKLIDLLHNEQDDVVLGLVTGNLEATAKLKLRSVNLDVDRFVVGGFGSDHADRNQLPLIALQRAMSLHNGHLFDPATIFVIGDTPKDIECARKNGFVSIAVATGRFRPKDLQVHSPDFLWQDMSDVEQVYKILVGKEIKLERSSLEEDDADKEENDEVSEKKEKKEEQKTKKKHKKKGDKKKKEEKKGEDERKEKKTEKKKEKGDKKKKEEKKGEDERKKEKEENPSTQSPIDGVIDVKEI